MLVTNPNQLLGLISRDKLKTFHTVQTWRGILAIVFEWAAIFLSAYLCEKYFSWLLYLVVVMFIGARLLALGFIMHESVHDLISKNEKLNDILAELFCAWPLLISMRSYRVKHLAHHKWLNTDEDPDYVAKFDPNWQYPMKKINFIKILLIQLSGFGIFETFRVMSSAQMKLKKDKAPTWYHVLRIAYYLAIISLFISFGKGRLLFMYWFVPFATWTQVANRLRRVAEHSAVKGFDLPMQTRTTKHGILARIFLAPKNISYHCEHHLYPGVPCYHLPELHQELIGHEKVRENTYVSRGYKAVLQDCTV